MLMSAQEIEGIKAIGDFLKTDLPTVGQRARLTAKLNEFRATIKYRRDRGLRIEAAYEYMLEERSHAA